MPILNYTTSVDVDRTVSQIHAMLVSHGAKTVVAEYDEAKLPSALSFGIRTAHGDRLFRVPANIERRYTATEQARRVAWRITKDWLEAQLAIVEAGLSPIDEVLLPYMLVRGKQTLYQFMEVNHLSLPAPRDHAGE